MLGDRPPCPPRASTALSYKKLNPRIFLPEYLQPNTSQVTTIMALWKMITAFFKLKFLIPTLRLMFCSPKPSNIYEESDFVSSVSRNKLEKYIFVVLKKRLLFLMGG